MFLFFYHGLLVVDDFVCVCCVLFMLFHVLSLLPKYQQCIAFIAASQLHTKINHATESDGMPGPQGQRCVDKKYIAYQSFGQDPLCGKIVSLI